MKRSESVERGEWKSSGDKRERTRYSRDAKATFRKDRRLNPSRSASRCATVIVWPNTPSEGLSPATPRVRRCALPCSSALLAFGIDVGFPLGRRAAAPSWRSPVSVRTSNMRYCPRSSMYFQLPRRTARCVTGGVPAAPRRRRHSPEHRSIDGPFLSATGPRGRSLRAGSCPAVSRQRLRGSAAAQELSSLTTNRIQA